MSAELGLASLAFACACAARCWAALRFVDQEGPDADFHRWYIRLLRENGHRLPESDPRGIGPGELTYPALFHWALSFGSELFVERFARFGGLALDGIVALATAAAIMKLTDTSMAFGLVLAALHLIAPQLTFAFIGPRAFTLSPRAASQNAFMLGTVLLVLTPSLDPQWSAVALVSATLAIAVALLSSKFALQNFVFVLGGVLVAGWTEVALVLVAAVPLSALLSGGFFLRQLCGHWRHSIWYLKLNRHYVSAFGDWRALGRALAGGDLRALAKELLVRNPVFVGLSRHATLFLALALSMRVFDAGALDGSIEVALIISVIALVPWIVTSIGPMRVFGEAERYLEYSFAAHWILLWTVVPANFREWLAVTVGVFFIAFYVANLLALAMQRRAHYGEARQAIMSEIAFREPVRVLPTDARYIKHLLAHTRAEVVGPTCQFSLAGDGDKYFRWYFSRFPFVSAARWREVLDAYNPDVVLLTAESKYAAVTETGAGYDLNRFRLAVVLGSVELWERKTAERVEQPPIAT